MLWTISAYSSAKLPIAIQIIDAAVSTTKAQPVVREPDVVSGNGWRLQMTETAQRERGAGFYTALLLAAEKFDYSRRLMTLNRPSPSSFANFTSEMSSTSC